MSVDIPLNKQEKPVNDILFYIVGDARFCLSQPYQQISVFDWWSNL